MASVFLLTHLIALSALVSFGGFSAYLTAGGESISVVDSSGETVFSVDALPGERLSNPCVHDSKLLFLSSASGLVQQDILTGVSVILRNESTGAPWISSNGDIWFTSDDILFRNGLSTGFSIPAFHVSIENGTASFTDRNDYLHVLSMESGEERVIDGYRFYSPTVLADGGVLSPTLTGEIILVPSGGDLLVAGYGEQPCWSYELEGFFYCVSEDDGHRLTGADIWFVIPGCTPVRVTDTPDVYETRPACSSGSLWYIDSNSGIPGCVKIHDLSL